MHPETRSARYRRLPDEVRCRGFELFHCQRGASFVEHIVLVCAIGLVAMGGYRRFSQHVGDKAEEQGDRVLNLEEGAAGPVCDGVDCACFVAGTPVATPNGPKPIETLRVGDLVLARDEATGSVDYKPVLRTYVTPSRPVLDVEVEGPDGKMDAIGATEEHPFFIEGRGWVRAKNLGLGEQALASSGRPLSVAAIGQRADVATVYNLEVDDYHTYFVGRAGAWVHNQYLDSKKGSIDSKKSHAGWGGSYRPPEYFPPPKVAINDTYKYHAGLPPGSDQKKATVIPAPGGGYYVYGPKQPTAPDSPFGHLSWPQTGMLHGAGEIPVAGILVKGVKGIAYIDYASRWLDYKTGASSWTYVRPPDHATIQAAPKKR